MEWKLEEKDIKPLPNLPGWNRKGQFIKSVIGSTHIPFLATFYDQTLYNKSANTVMKENQGLTCGGVADSTIVRTQ